MQAPETETMRGSEYAQLSRRIRQAGLLDRRPAYYAWKIGITAVLLAAGWAAFVLVGDSWWQLAVAVYLAVMFTQVGFLGHDAGHRQILRSRKANYVIGVLHGNLGIGLSYGWWVSKHNRHHAHPNQPGEDPYVTLSVLAFTADQAGTARGLGRLVFQAIAQRDLIVVQDLVVMLAGSVIVVNFLVDLAAAWIDPRLRAASA